MEHYRRTAHTRFDIKFHLVWITKYRKKLLQADVAIRLRQLVRVICSELEVEILKGHVTLGSLRVRQDRLIFEGLAGADKTGTGAPDDPVQLALARIRQLGAHEVGHSLGLAHNFAASTYGRASVMDYPAPLVGMADGKASLTAKVVADKDAKTIALENYATAPVIFQGVKK